MNLKYCFSVVFSALVLNFTNVVAQNVPPVISAVSNSTYCPLTQQNIVSDFSIVDPDNTSIDALLIQISQGYVSGEDLLQLTGSHPAITTSWNAQQGKLTLTGPGYGTATYTDLIAAVKDVVYSSSSISVSGEKHFSITIDAANYLPSTGHYYKYFSAIGITWANAKIAAEAENYYGLQGYLATITSAEEAQLSGEQAEGAGWIGGSDAENEGIWKWVTGPENGMVFWNGLANGSSPGGVYSNWNVGEPNQAGDEDYAHVTAPNVGNPGSWNDLSNAGNPSGDYQPKGYIVEFGGMPGDPVLNISAATSLRIAEITSVTNSSICGAGSLTLAANSSEGNVVWFTNATGGSPIFTGNTFTTPVLSNTTQYYVVASANNCLNGPRTEVTATINPLPIISTPFTLKNCDEDGIADGFTDFNLEEANPFITNGDNTVTVRYYTVLSDAQAGNSNQIVSGQYNNALSNVVYARIENSFGCFEIAQINLEVSTTSFPPNFLVELTSCDDDATADGFKMFDLTQATSQFLNNLPAGQNLTVQYYQTENDALLEQNEITTPTNYTNEVAFSQSLFIRVESATDGSCYGIGEHLQLTVLERPEFEVNPTALVCLNLSPIALQTFNANGNYTYEWFNASGGLIGSTPSFTVGSGGVYLVEATSFTGCKSFRKSVTVSESIIASITYDDIIVNDDSNNNSITINTNNLGIGDYEFALNSSIGPYQDEPFFDNVEAGIHTVFVRDKNNCGLAQIDVSVIGFPKYFTPNNDGINDVWKIKGADRQFYQSINLVIFDRFGKQIAVINSLTEGWNGVFNGEYLPATDYWYVAVLTDLKGNVRDKKGHFSLIRR